MTDRTTCYSIYGWLDESNVHADLNRFGIPLKRSAMRLFDFYRRKHRYARLVLKEEQWSYGYGSCISAAVMCDHREMHRKAPILKDRMMELSHDELVLHAVLLVRTVNQHWNKEKDIALYSQFPKEELADYIIHFDDPVPEPGAEGNDDDFFGNDNERYDCPSSTAGDYSPSHPWDAPGMSISDFI